MEDWRAVGAHVERAGKLATPWSEAKGYRVERVRLGGWRVVGVLERRSALGVELARVTSHLSSESTYELVMGGKGAPKTYKRLADALSEADAQLQVQGYEVVGRVVWQEAGP